VIRKRRIDGPRKGTTVHKGILMVTGITGAENCAAALSKQFGIPVVTVATSREASSVLRRREFAIVVIDSSLVELREDGADSLLKHAGLAIPLEMNFAISGCGRLVREVRAALARREREHELAISAAAASIETVMRETVAGLLLQLQLAIAESGASSQLSERLRLVLELAVSLRDKLERSGPHKAEKPVLLHDVRTQQKPRSIGPERAAAALPG
jgi:hypothetical protein